MIARRFFIIPVALLVALAVGYSVLWVAAAQWTEDGFRNWARIQTERGTVVTHGALAISGFPGPIELTIATPSVVSPKGGWQWSAPRAVLETRPWAWWRYRLEVFGDQKLGLPFSGKLHRYTVHPAEAVVIGEIDSMGQLSKGVLRATDVSAKNEVSAVLGSAKSVEIHLNRRTPGATTENQTALDLALQAETVEMGPMFETPLGKQIQDIGLVAAVKGTLPQTFLREAIDAWRQSGGTVDLSHFRIDWGKLILRGNGTVTVDDQFRPLGALTADIKGYGETLKALERARVLRRRDVNGTRLALDLLSRQDEADNRRMVSIPITAQGGMLYLGPVRLLKLAPIPFPVRPD